MRVRNRWGWGFEDAAISDAGIRAGAPGLVGLIGFGETEPEAPVPFDPTALPAARLAPPDHLRGICTVDAAERAAHARGQSYLDTVHGLRGVFAHVPDAVARPRAAREIEDVLEWAHAANAAVIPYGGGTSASAASPRACPTASTAGHVDLGAIDAVRGDRHGLARGAHRRRGERAADRGAARRPRHDAALLPAVVRALDPRRLDRHPRGRALRHAPDPHRRPRRVRARRRAGGPLGVAPPARLRRRPLARPDAPRLGGDPRDLAEAWVRIRPRPVHRAGRAVRFDSFLGGADAVRALAQSELEPANCRLIDALEAAQVGAGDGRRALLTLGFESADHPVGPWLDRALEICREHGGDPDEPGDDGAARSWREGFFRMPYLRDMLVRLGIFTDTFESAVTWERFPAFHVAVRGRSRRVGDRAASPAASRTSIPTAPRRTSRCCAGAARRRGRAVARDEAGGRPRDPRRRRDEHHHHGVGRDHRPWYDAQRPDAFAAALRAAKHALDPAGLLNPGVLIDP